MAAAARRAWPRSGPSRALDATRLQGPGDEVVAVRPDDLNIDKVAGAKRGGVAVGQVDLWVDVGGLARQPATHDQIVVRGRTVDEEPQALADPGPLSLSDDLL